MFRQASNRCKRVLETAKLAYANKTKESITSQKLGSQDFWRIPNSVLNKSKPTIPPLFNDRRCYLLHLTKQNCLLKTFLRTQILKTQVFIPLPSFPSRTNLKLHNITVTPEMVKEVIRNLDSSTASGPDCIPEVVLINCEPELSYILAKFSI